MTKKLLKLYDKLEYLLSHAPSEGHCNEKVNEMYDDMANLKQSMENYVLRAGEKTGKPKKHTKKKIRVQTEVVKKIVSETGSEFRVGGDISFVTRAYDGSTESHVICKIVAIEDDYIIGTNIETSKRYECNVPYQKFLIKDMSDLRYVFYD